MPVNEEISLIQTDKIKKKIVLAKSFAELKRKACLEFKIDSNNVKFVLQDGTEVSDDDFLQTRSNYTCLTVLTEGELHTYLPQRVKEALDTIATVITKNKRIFIEADEFVEEKVHLLQQLQKIIEKIIVPDEEKFADLRKEHVEWFEGLDERYISKKEYMKGNAEHRIRSYYYKTKVELQRRNLPEMLLIDLLIDLKNLLKRDNYNGHLFVRGELKALCTEEGTFSCQGRYNASKCDKAHTLNPYLSSEHRKLFSTWNLDHRIERSRTIIPAVVNAIRDLPVKSVINSDYFYSLLFTSANLELVHIACHDKSKHDGFKCDKNMCYR
ncbi:DNA fragmentation factor subunit beta-like [Tachypleus tridentatus]|uniref:DNA fragmentation factor subunit beta-like n=1 Tax=Tachypleus tridentatus TaxID=6853 RepID=UPI003FD50D5F